MKQVKITTTYAKPPAKSRPLVSVTVNAVDNVYARNLRENDFKLENVKTALRTKTTRYTHADGRIATIVTDVVKGVEVSLALSAPGEKKALMNDDALAALMPPGIEEPAKKVDAMLHEAARTATPRQKERRDPPAAPIISDEPRTAPANPPKASPLHQALKKAQFKFVKAEVVASTTVYGYQHRDRRAVLLTVTPTGTEVWTLRWPDGAESGGKKADILAGCLKITAGKHVAAKDRAAVQDEREAGKTDEARTVLAAVKPSQLLPDGPADHVLHAVEMLGQLTAKRYDFMLLRGDRYYGDRMALLRVLLDRGRGEVKAAETGINTVQAAFYSALGVRPGCAAARAAAFTERCIELIDAWRKAQKLVQKAGARMTAKRRRDNALDRIAPGSIIPYSKQRSKTAEKEEREKEVATLASELRSSLPEAKPNQDASLIGPVDVRAIRSVSYNNGAFGLRLERGNSQGALQLISNGKRLSVSVLTPVLAEMANVEHVSIDVVKGLLTAMEQSNLARTPNAEKALTAVKAAVKAACGPWLTEPVVLPMSKPCEAINESMLRMVDVRLLANSELGAVLLRLEVPNSQGALCVCNTNGVITVGMVPADVLAALFTVPGADVRRIAGQLIASPNPGPPLSPVAQRCLTALAAAAAAASDYKDVLMQATRTVNAKLVKKVAMPKGNLTGERKSNLFRLLNESKAVWSAFKTQKSEIVAAFIKLEAVSKKARGVTRAELIAALPNVPPNNVSFYLSKWQKSEPVIVEKLAAAE